MKFGDKIRFCEELEKKFIDFILFNDEKHLLENCLLFLKEENNKIYVAPNQKLVEICAATSVSFFIENKLNNIDGFAKFPWFILYEKGLEIGVWKSKEEFKLVKRSSTDDAMVLCLERNQLMIEDIKIISGGQCKICHEYNPWACGDYYCYVCRTDPRNDHRVEK